MLGIDAAAKVRRRANGDPRAANCAPRRLQQKTRHFGDRRRRDASINNSCNLLRPRTIEQGTRRRTADAAIEGEL